MRSQPSLYRLLPLSLLLLNSLPGSTASAELARRGCKCSKQDTDDDGNCRPVVLSDVADQVADSGKTGIGFEFETGEIRLKPDDCSRDKIELTADTTEDDEIDVEYILNGKTITLGSGDLKKAAEDVAKDITDWNPWSGMDSNSFEVDQNECKNWKVILPTELGEAAKVTFALQATAPLAVEAVQDLFGKAIRGEGSKLLPSKTLPATVYVTKDFFQTSPGGLAPDSLKDDILGYFSVVLSYAKADKKGDEDSSVKDVISIMLRNDFSSTFKLLKDQGAMPGIQGSLWDLVKTLSCYKNNGNDVVFDNNFCDGDAGSPKPKDGKLEGMTYERGGDKCTMKEWIDAIEAGTTPDPISRVDQKVDGSVGRFRDNFEVILNTQRKVPIWEFRRLKGATPEQLGTRVEEVENEIKSYHDKLANAPRMLRRKPNAKYSHIKRDDPSDVCDEPTPTKSQGTNTPPPTTPSPEMPSCSMQYADPDQGINRRGCVCGSTTLPLLTIPDATKDTQSCSYTAMPSSSVSNPITIAHQTYTTNCYACTLVGGIADTPSCATTPVSGCVPTTPPTPTATVWLSNNSIPIGNENNRNSGADLRNEVFQKLKALCPDNANACNSKGTAEIDHVKTIVGDDPMEETIKFVIQDSQYHSLKERDQMLAAAVASWEQAVSKSCKEVEYEDYEDLTKSGCGTGTVKRALMTPEERRNTRRAPAPVCDDCSPPPPPECHYKATVCTGPDHINPVLSGTSDGPYSNHMNIQLSFEIGSGSGFNEFICELVVDGLTALAMAVAPELAGPEMWEDIELQAICEGMADQIGSRDVNVTENALLIGA